MITDRSGQEAGAPRAASAEEDLLAAAPGDGPHADGQDAPDAVTPAKPIGLIGLGLVGRALGARLRRAGFEVHGLDRDAGAQAAWVAEGGVLAASLASMGAACATVVLAVYDTAGVLQVVEGDGGLCKAAGPACSSTAPPAIRRHWKPWRRAWPHAAPR